MTPSDLYRKLTFVTGTVAASGDTTLIAAPGAGLTLVLVFVQLQNESTTATTLKFKFGSSEVYRLLAQNQGEGVVAHLPAGREWRVGANLPLVLNLSGANSCGYSLAYYVEAVNAVG